VIRSTLAHPNTLNCDVSSLLASAAYDIDFKLADIDYRRLLCHGCCYAVNWQVGARYGKLDQDLLATYSILGTTTVETAIDFDGFGPRLGLDGEILLCKGLSLYGRGAASFLLGHFAGDLVQQNTFSGVLVTTTYSNDRIVPILELDVGLGWTSPAGRVRLLAGYYLASWFNTVTTPDLINAVQLNNFSNSGDALSGTITFDGLTARVELRF
jgi:hypothetical protein